MKKNIFITTLIIGAMLLFTFCRPQQPTEEETITIEAIDEEISEELIDELTKNFGASLVENVTHGDYSITYSFLLPMDLTFIQTVLLRVGVVRIFNELGYDIDETWQINADGKLFTEYQHKNILLILTIDPQTNILCFEITKK